MESYRILPTRVANRGSRSTSTNLPWSLSASAMNACLASAVVPTIQSSDDSTRLPMNRYRHIENSKRPEGMTKLIKVGLFVLSLSAASSLQQLSHAQVAEAPASSIFKVVPTPNIRSFPFHSDLDAVSASSASDIWAVGQSGVHFDGKKWTAFALPDIAGDLTSRLTGVVDLALTTFGRRAGNSRVGLFSS